MATSAKTVEWRRSADEEWAVYQTGLTDAEALAAVADLRKLGHEAGIVRDEFRRSIGCD